ncbi:Uncharacterized conserved protein, DUF1501 family [Cognatiyoonia koreensis]|uniref:Uncharacterized conserved protein, DUF1501 family n=1 Tax=Cognatiyoonia koreensis TaxID=364200 RepID=A0A1I0QWK1_9RHOB|nr:DUF1501 domain-containing protein [Cognatiyoonia koreensis]SEW31848.1 Uncharacterized conserved protein, DUF1501 family [Cognatiyoonia koreensis]
MADPILVVLFLRGGCDGLNLVCPAGDADLVAARPDTLRVERKGDDAGLLLSEQAADVDFRLHPQAKFLWELFEAKELAIIHAAGLTDGTRSHFDAEAKMERAAPNGAAGGWLGRYLTAIAPEGLLPTLAIGSEVPDSLGGAAQVALAEQLSDLIIAQGWDIAPLLKQRLASGFGTHSLLAQPVERLLQLSSLLESRIVNDAGEVTDYVPEADYPECNLSRSLISVAQSIKLDMGLRVATVDFGGWDTHMDQSSAFGGLVHDLSGALGAFWRDLGTHQEHTTVVVMSEFGRRLRANTSGGTDHGFGNAMMVLGPTVKGGRMIGAWPGLSNDALDSGADLDITTDYRTVLSDVMTRHMKFDDIDLLFPGFTYRSAGIFA